VHAVATINTCTTHLEKSNDIKKKFIIKVKGESHPSPKNNGCDSHASICDEHTNQNFILVLFSSCSNSVIHELKWTSTYQSMGKPKWANISIRAKPKQTCHRLAILSMAP
jgi:hypothetical protein